MHEKPRIDIVLVQQLDCAHHIFVRKNDLQLHRFVLQLHGEGDPHTRNHRNDQMRRAIRDAEMFEYTHPDTAHRYSAKTQTSEWY